MTEGEVYYATAQRLSRGWRLSITKPKRLSVEGMDLEELKDDLADEICGCIGDGEAVIEVANEPATANTYVRLLANESVVCPKRPEGLFHGGYCSWCGAGIGSRTTEPLQLSRTPRANLACADVSLREILLISRRLVGVLQLEGHSCQLRPTVVRGKESGELLEIIATGERTCVAQKGSLSDVSFQCPRCSFRQVFVKHRIKTGFYSAIARSDVPASACAFAAGDDRSSPTICVPRDRWREVARLPEKKGVSTAEIVMVAADAVATRPQLPALEKLV